MKTLYRTAGALLLAAAVHGVAWAAPEPRTQAEIAHLLDYVATPGCEFNRNGSWHAGADARAHLQKKYDYLLKRKLVTDAEQHEWERLPGQVRGREGGGQRGVFAGRVEAVQGEQVRNARRMWGSVTCVGRAVRTADMPALR
jgi:hypothetical protein